jgi:hypothetical protein
MKDKIKTLIGLIVLLSISLSFSSCVSYSFTGASIPPEAKTISIQYFDNHASFVNPTLSESLTTAVKDRFTNQTSLVLVRQNGDLQIEGVITDYHSTPQSITAGEVAAQTRLTIKVKVKFVNLLQPENNFETTFSRYQEYASTRDLAEVQDALIILINEMLVDDIFNKAVVNW